MKVYRIQSPLTLLFCCLLLASDCLCVEQTPKDELWEQYRAALTDSSRIELLIAIADVLVNLDNELVAADSVGRLAFTVATASHDKDLELRTFISYLDLNPDNPFQKTSSAYKNKLIQLLKETKDHDLIWKANASITRYYLANYDWDEALGYATAAHHQADLFGDPTERVWSCLLIGQCFEGRNEKAKAFKKYMMALTLAEADEDSELLAACYHRIARFFEMTKIHDKALDYKRKQLAQLEKGEPTDSIAIMYCILGIEEIEWTGGIDSSREETIFNVLDYCYRHGNSKLKELAITIYRSQLIASGQFERLKEFYVVQHPEELANLRKTHFVKYLRVKAMTAEFDGQLDSAQYFLDLAGERIKDDPNYAFRSRYYFRYAEFLHRKGDIEGARNQYLAALESAEKSNYLPFALDAAERLEDLFLTQKDFASAHHYSNISRLLEDSFAHISTREEVLRLEVENESSLRKVALKERELAVQAELNKANTKTILSVISTILLFIFAIGLWSRLSYVRRSSNVIEQERNRSERLLLNILPEEIAQELKSTGKAVAKNFDMVTILFTDFNDFTGISGKLAAEELVTKVNSYYEVFDELTENFKVEKIKTIGDSYMVAGGLPIPQHDSAKRTVMLALAMQQYVSDQYAIRKAQGDSAFQMRVGLHSGPVVAGIVGKRKFQYDLWGDTVNTASRIETCGEIGKVNISQFTYELIRHDPDFIFEPRGKIEVKGKGMMYMYFVELAAA